MENSLVRVIPASRLADVEMALSQTFGSGVVDEIGLLSGGLSGSGVYKMVVDGRVYVLKLEAPSAGGADALIQASKAGIAPRVCYREPSAGATITEFIESQPIRAAFAPEKLVSELAKTIRAVHALPCRISGRDLRQFIAGIIDGFVKSKLLSGPIIEECFTRYAAIERRYPWEDTDRVFSHNDINPGNLLCDGSRLWVVDWDGAWANDRYVDLATAANFFVQTEELESEYLKAYFEGELDEYKKARFHVMRQVSRIIYAVLLVQVAERNKPEGCEMDQEMEGKTLKAFGELMGAGKLWMTSYEGQLMYGKAQMNEAVRQMRLPRFAEAMGRL